MDLGHNIVRMIQSANELQKQSSDCKDIDRMIELVQQNMLAAQGVLCFCMNQRGQASDGKTTKGIDVH